MKLNQVGSGGFFVFIAAIAAFMQFAVNSCSAQVTVTVTPAVTSNTYSGDITLNITGLTNGEQVKVQTYLDLNGSGGVQANDPLWDVFNLSDGGAQVIGGITNVSVPYDSNTATGAITTSLSFALPLESITGQKIYRVVSNPAGAFAPVTAVLDITNASTGQSVSGTVYSNGVAPLPNAVVVALTATNQNVVSGTIADGSGKYFLTLNPGAYVLLAALPGYYTDQRLAPEVTLTNGESATNNLVLTNGTVAIAGSVYDQGNSNALGGVFLQGTSGTFFEVAFTDTNGNYSFGGTSNNWKIKISDERLSRRGYLAPEGNALVVDAGSGSVSNADIGLYKGNALFYGQLTISNTPVPNAAIEGNDNNQFLSGKAYTDLNGNYGIVALVNAGVLGTNDTWDCAPNASDETGARVDTLVNDIYNQVENAPLATNESYLQNFVGLPITATISGQLVNNQGVPISGVGVGGAASINGIQFVTAFVDTDNNGNFSFGAANGQWNVQPNCCGSDGLDNFGYYAPFNYVVNIPPASQVVNIVVYPSDLPLLSQPSKVSASQFNVNLYGASGDNYTLQATTNLATGNWSTVTIVTNLPGNPYLIQDFHATNGARFYRAFQGP
jgi:hypothetical protein